MLSCWNAIPESRPSFTELEKRFSNILDPGVSDHYIALNEQYSSTNNILNDDQTDFLALISSPKSQNLSKPNPQLNFNSFVNPITFDVDALKIDTDIFNMDNLFKSQYVNPKKLDQNSNEHCENVRKVESFTQIPKIRNHDK